jgi:hypothetical protein
MSKLQAAENFAKERHSGFLHLLVLQHFSQIQSLPNFVMFGSDRNRFFDGIILVLKPGKKIVQAWRVTGWWPDHYSIAIFDIEKVKNGTRLHFTQIGIPPNRYSGHYRGWIEAYWTLMKEVFTHGVISEKTLMRVHADKKNRINTKSFRRKISNKA